MGRKKTIGETPIERSCLICGKIFYTNNNKLNHGKGITCSKTCGYQSVRDKLKKRICCKCDTCGKTIEKTPSTVTEYNFCSQECRARGQTKVRTGKFRDIEAHRLSGRKFGKWSVGEKVIDRSNGKAEIRYKCRCECGNEQLVKYTHLLDKTATRCRTCSSKSMRGQNSPHWSGFGDLPGSHFISYKNGAVSRNFAFEITIEDAWAIFLSQNKKCALTGLSLEMRERSRSSPTASLDRIDSKQGYLKNNIRWVHKVINLMKWDSPDQEFIQFCGLVVRWTTTDNRDVEKLDEDTVLDKMWTSPSKKAGPLSWKWSGFKGITGSYWNHVQQGAKSRNLKFNIKLTDMWDMFLTQGGRCAYTGIELELKRNSKHRDWTASIDRIDSSKHYELDNVCWCHTLINRMKTNLSVKDFCSWCAKVTSHCQ